MSEDDQQRLDKWLWFTRTVKTRSLAQKLVKGGHIRVNRERTTSPSFVLKPEDVLTIALPKRIRILKFVKAGTRRGPAVEAATLYQDLTPPPVPMTAEERARKGPAPAPDKRPDKRARRDLIRLKGTDD
uniref:RNA-binding S4 domain-containing protein n=1 Tax=Pararhizobium sp. IMCC3301 TaxID=3067904 RepID=UPI00274160C9|nr:RNA-binding S4 domain-containing protein [Pararhizobium sp. IMCC3301]